MRSVHEVGLLDESPDALQEALVKLAAQICGTPISAVSLIDTDRQWFSAICGLACRETPREVAFCAHTILADAPLIVPDATRDQRFAENPLVVGPPGIRFYAGIPLRTGNGLPLGSLCVIDTVPRQISPGQVESLTTLAALVATQLELFRRNAQLRDQDHAQQEVLGRLNKIASRVPGVIYQFRLRPDGTSCFPYASDGIRQIYRVTPEQVREDAGDVFSILHPDDLGPVSASIEQSARTLTPWKYEYRVRFPDGVERWLLGDAVPEREGDGGTLWHGFITDITARKQSEEALGALNVELASARHAAETANRVKSAFLANMSHEIRTPLTAILGFADLLHDEPGLAGASDEHARSIETIRKAGQHLLTVINDILDISKIEAGKMTVEKVRTPLVPVLREVECLIRPQASAKGVSLSTVLSTPVPEHIIGDPTRLRQILLNLVGNAVKFTDVGGVTVSAGFIATESETLLAIDVRDSGCGISVEQAAGLFQPFGQADEGVTRRHGGTGLGLTICRRLALLMGGNVQLLHSAPGEGSCFRLTLPVERTAASALVRRMDEGRPAVAPAVSGVSLTGRILLVEDGSDNQRLICFHLRRSGATVDTAENGRIALDLMERAALEGRSYDLILTDMQMPLMDGYTLTNRIRRRGIRIPIIALTANAMAEDRDRCIQAGCDDFATKPIDKSSLIATCAAWIGRESSAIAAPVSPEAHPRH